MKAKPFWMFCVGLFAWAEGLGAAALETRSVTYDVRSGDNLTAIAKKHGVTVDAIRQANGISGDRIDVGQKLAIPTYKLSLWVDKSDNTLVLKGDEEVLKTYAVATGTDNSTPVGTFKITDKLENPTWFKAGAVKAPGDPENQLGSRWLGFDLKGYGIHGTIDPASIGKQVTAGCVRMRNEDVEELYRLVPPGTPVTISD
jgi:lipoprotein-anchoring transpeptidase ErfK/SrfK